MSTNSENCQTFQSHKTFTRSKCLRTNHWRNWRLTRCWAAYFPSPVPLPGRNTRNSRRRTCWSIDCFMHRHAKQHKYKLLQHPTAGIWHAEHYRDYSHYSSSHQTACFKATEGLPPSPYRAALNHQYSFATLRVLSCLHSPVLRCSCYNVVRFCCDREACDLVTATVKLSLTTQKWDNYFQGKNRRYFCHVFDIKW
jgi:hypothetical protein